METIKEAQKRGATPQNYSDIPKDILVSVCTCVYIPDIYPIQHCAFLKQQQKKKHELRYFDSGWWIVYDVLELLSGGKKNTHLIPTIHSLGRQAIGSEQSLISWEISPRGWLLDLDEESVQLTDITWRPSSYFEMESAFRLALFHLKYYRINSNAAVWLCDGFS